MDCRIKRFLKSLIFEENVKIRPYVRSGSAAGGPVPPGSVEFPVAAKNFCALSIILLSHRSWEMSRVYYQSLRESLLTQQLHNLYIKENLLKLLVRPSDVIHCMLLISLIILLSYQSRTIARRYYVLLTLRFITILNIKREGAVTLPL